MQMINFGDIYVVCTKSARIFEDVVFLNKDAAQAVAKNLNEGSKENNAYWSSEKWRAERLGVYIRYCCQEY